MSLAKSIVTSILVQGIALTAFAQNRQSSDSIFKARTTAPGYDQIFIGVLEVLSAKTIAPGLIGPKAAVKNAQVQLAIANDLPLSDADRANTMEAIHADAKSYNVTGSLKEESIERLESLHTRVIFSVAEKDAAIKAAQARLTEARSVALKLAQDMGLLDRAVKFVRVGSALMLVSDAGARAWVWYAMDAEPTVSPSKAYIKHMMDKAVTEANSRWENR